MKYVVVFNDDNGKMYIKNEFFQSHMEAETYADTVDSSRQPTILPYIPMYPEKNGEFGCDDFDKMAKMVEEVKDLLLFSSDTAGATPVAEHQMVIALNHMSNAEQHLRLAALAQTEAVAARGGR